MKTLLHYTKIAMALCVTTVAQAQIDYQENFSAGATGWAGSGFEATAVGDCSGNGAIRARVNKGLAENRDIVALSAPLGVSDGSEVVLQYDVRLLAYDAVLPQNAVPNGDFGRVTVDAATTPQGPWTLIDRIDISNYVPTTECLRRTASVEAPTGQRLYLRFTAMPGTAITTDFYVYIDEIRALQGATVTGLVSTEVATLASAYINPADNYLHIEYAAPVDEWAIFNMQGQQVSVRDLDGNGTRLDISGLAFGNYMIKLRSADRIETLNIMKK
ncbi:MAG: T9SS type A sorting domain-containing protein [Flavobacterium sp.]